ncbi:ATP-binding protein [Pseudodesulfovibrio sp.]|uniref:sensor histidine kinase n=1 Tax=Pseudodesulfovibrio sp. TaxID=2035812 RepID=UPI00261F379D|nr:ATP-binding protein [Pseudodesulfovibrio sp.]MDD3311741.1 ATP-binding protein [Pseudodesulfovibrio sp.]
MQSQPMGHVSQGDDLGPGHLDGSRGADHLANGKGPSFSRVFTLMLAVFFLVQAGLAVFVAVWIVGGEMASMRLESVQSQLNAHRDAFRGYVDDRMALLGEYAATGRIAAAVTGGPGGGLESLFASLPMLGEKATFCLQDAAGGVIAAPPHLAGRLPQGNDLVRLSGHDRSLGVFLPDDDPSLAWWRLSVPVLAHGRFAGALSAFIRIEACHFLSVPEDGTMSVAIVWRGRVLDLAGLEPAGGLTLRVQTGYPGIELVQTVSRKLLDRRVRHVLLLLIAGLTCGMLLLVLAVRLAGRRLLIIPHARLEALSQCLERDMARRTADLERQAARLSQEIRERREAESEARETGQLVTALLEGINAAFYVLNPATGRIVRANTVIRAMFGLKPEAIIGLDCRAAFAGASGGTLRLLCPDAIEAAYAEGVASHASGASFPMARYLVELEIRGETHIGVIVLDISERKTLERRLNIAQKLESVGELASGIAHEINTPIQYVGDSVRFVSDALTDLSAIMAVGRELLRLCREEGGHPAIVRTIDDMAGEADLDFVLREAPKACARALEGTERVAVIVRAMKNFAHPGDGRKKGVNINESLANTLTVAKNEWKYVADVVEDYGDIPIVNCLAGDISQVFLNIVVNAAHAIGDVVGNSGEKGTIAVSTRAEEGMVVIRISDSGTGIPPENRDKIFDPFFTTKEVGRGTGQGLAIVHDIVVERHGGSIDVESEVGRGATFIITLPPES